MKRKQNPENVDIDSGPMMMDIDEVATGSVKRRKCVPDMMEIDGEKQKPIRRRKAYIPKALKIAVWKKYIGIEKGTSLCMVCNTNTISQMDFHCGHIEAEANGGPTCLTNLLPICGKCNGSMGKQNLCEFKDMYFK